MTAASSVRLQLLGGQIVDYARDLSKSQAFQKALNLAPGIGDIVMAGKAVLGREGGQDLNPRVRFVYGAAAVTEFVSAALVYSGQYSEAALMHAISETLSKSDAAIAIMKSAASKIAEKKPQLAHMITATSGWISKKKGAPEELSETMPSALGKFDLEAVNE